MKDMITNMNTDHPRQSADPRHVEMLRDPVLEVRQVQAYLPVSRAVYDDIMRGPTFAEMVERAEELQRAWNALPEEERARITAARKAEYEAKRCPACGCHPDEHGGE